MTKSKTKFIRSRPDVYQQALAAAKKRLEKALTEKEECRAQLFQLNAEIPRLQKIIDAFEGPITSEPGHMPLIDEQNWGRAVLDKPAVQLPTVKLPATEALRHIPEHLKGLIKPLKPDPLPDGQDPDRFLPDVE